MKRKRLPLSEHARVRLAQRNIPDFMLLILDFFGVEERQTGARKIFLDGRAKANAHDTLKSILSRWDSLQDVYKVTDSGNFVITAGFRNAHACTKGK